VIRPATAAELPRLADIHAAAFDRPWTAAAIAELLAGPGGLALAAEEDGVVAGFVLLRTAAGEAEILTLAVAQAHRRRGIGRALIAAALQAVADMGAESLWLEVAEDNAPARRLYEAAAFGEAGRRRGYYPRPGGAAADAILLRRILNRPAPSAYAAPP
jgi:ribosomal-protein-alanine N-acetyltransferase